MQIGSRSLESALYVLQRGISLPSSREYQGSEMEMQNAHERFGTLEFTKRTKDTTTRVRVHIDRVVLESARDERGQANAHLISMVGGDSEIGALWAAVTEGALFQIRLPGRAAPLLLSAPRPNAFAGV